MLIKVLSETFEVFLRQTATLLIDTRLTGTVLAQLLLWPIAYIIVTVAEFL
ncbi:lipid II flippase family protein [Chloroflexota bacterium]